MPERFIKMKEVSERGFYAVEYRLPDDEVEVVAQISVRYLYTPGYFSGKDVKAVTVVVLRPNPFATTGA